MNLQFNEWLPDNFDPSSRVWIYQCSRLFTMSEAFEIEEKLTHFVNNWKTHGTPVKGYANLLYGQFIVFMADETGAGVSGCSTDSSVHVIKEIEKDFNVSLFDRMLLAFIVKDKIEQLPLSQLKYAVEKGFITPDTLFFNNVVLTKAEMLSNWIIPAKNSWLTKKISFPATVPENE
jgi:hypothetical protein